MTVIEIGTFVGLFTIFSIVFGFFRNSIMSKVESNKELIESQTNSLRFGIENNHENIVKLFEKLEEKSKRDALCSENHNKHLIDAIDKVINKVTTEYTSGLDRLEKNVSDHNNYQNTLVANLEKRLDKDIKQLENRTNKIEDDTKHAIEKVEDELKTQSVMLSDIKALLTTK